MILAPVLVERRTDHDRIGDLRLGDLFGRTRFSLSRHQHLRVDLRRPLQHGGGLDILQSHILVFGAY